MVRQIALLGLLAAVSGCGGGDAGEEAKQPPVFVIGMDGLEWDVMVPLLDAGRLPHFQAMIERGVGGGLATFQPTFSPVVWTSIATGVPRETHGVLNFSEEVNGRLKQGGLPYTSNARQVPAIWNMASDAGRSVLSVGWWVSWPAEEVNGRIVASYAAQAQGQLFWKAGVWEEGLPEMTWPEELIYDVVPLLEEGAPDGALRQQYEDRFSVIPGEPGRGPDDPSDPWAFPRGRDAFFRIGYHGDATHLAIFEQELANEVADLNMVYFGLPDVAGHFWWRYYEPDAFRYESPEPHIEMLKHRLDLSYEVADQWLGRIVEAAPKDARFLIVSDHGMHAANLNNPRHPQSGAHEDAPPGVMIAAGPGIAARGLLPEVEWRFPVRMGPRRYDNILQAPERLGGVYDVTPTILHWLGMPSAEDLAGEPLLGLAEEGHPLGQARAKVPTYAVGFRAATPPRSPSEDANRQFMESFAEQLGYLEQIEGGSDSDG